MIHLSLTLRLIAILAAVVFASLPEAFGQDVADDVDAQIDADTTDATVTFRQGETWKSLSLERWRFHLGDDPAWANPAFDDSEWQFLETRTWYDTLRAIGWEGIAWWRIKIIADSARPGWYPMLFLNQQAGASEAYLNGERVQRSGIPSSDRNTERTINREEVVPIDLRQGENILAVRYSFTRALEVYDRFARGWPPGPSVVLTEGTHWQFERRPARRFDSAVTMWIGGALLMMLITHLLLFLFNRADRSNLFFAIFAALVIGMPFQELIMTGSPALPLEGMWVMMVAISMMAAALVMLVAALHIVFYGRLLKTFWVLAAAMVVSYIESFTDFDLEWPIVQYLMMAEMLRVTFVAFWKKKDGRWVIGTGVLVLLGLIVLAVTGLLPGDIARPMILMTFPISVSVLLAVRSAKRNQELEEQRRTIARHAEELEGTVEKRTAELKQSLEDLTKAQNQLVQSEKMASLGSLTAGIAHEIKNPLNFINNFAEVNEELAAELKQAIASGESVDDIVADLQQNAKVIAEHGKRADGIVRAMMQHARGGAGERESVDVNALVKEYIGLAYHGKRAQVPDFNATIEEEYDESVGKVSMVPQDIGRVLVNLIGNAFDAVYEKAARENGEYVPTVKVSTFRNDGQIEIRVEDNGPGVPNDLRSKIFEPFFTTKPTGSGTGVGLSLSYDIVTQGHSGSLRVEESPGGGASFVVTLPG